ncbi:MAG: PHP domain-containing protein [Merdibacter sp.]
MTTQLMVRSAYTLLKSTMRVEEIPALAKEYGYTSVALCDVHVLHGAMAFRHACEACGIHPIYGMEVFCTLAQEEESAGFVVLAQNDAGFGELLSLSTWINTQKEPLTIEVLAKHTSNCYVISDAQEDLLYSLLVHEDAAGVRRYLQQMQRSFVHFVCGITKNDSRFLSQRNQLLRRCAAEMDIPARPWAVSTMPERAMRKPIGCCVPSIRDCRSTTRHCRAAAAAGFARRSRWRRSMNRRSWR